MKKRSAIIFNLTLILFVGLTAHDLVDIETLNSNIKLDLRYATTNNFTKQVMYDRHKCYLRREAAQLLCKVQQELEKQGLNLKVWDGYRPHSAQKKLWALCPDKRYVTNPAKGGFHTRGIAVDCTLVDKAGNELEMPTGFDDFTEKAHRYCKNISDEAKKNRKLLEDIMVKHGFVPFFYEWWHFNYKGFKSYEVLDVSFAKLEKEINEKVKPHVEKKELNLKSFLRKGKKTCTNDSSSD